MSAQPSIPVTNHTTRFRIFRLAAVVVAALCAVFIIYAAINVGRDYFLVKAAFPSLPAGQTTDMEVSILLSPAMLLVDRTENRFLHFIKDPNLTLPNATPPVRNTIGDEIRKAQKEQDLQLLDGVRPVDHMIQINQSSIDAFGRAIYLSQERPASGRVEQGLAASIGDPAADREGAIKQLRQIFALAYGEKAAEEAEQPQK